MVHCHTVTTELHAGDTGHGLICVIVTLIYNGISRIKKAWSRNQKIKERFRKQSRHQEGVFNDQKF